MTLGRGYTLKPVNHALKQEETRLAEAIPERPRIPRTACSLAVNKQYLRISTLVWLILKYQSSIRRDCMIVIILEFKVNVSKPLNVFLIVFFIFLWETHLQSVCL